MLMYAVGPCAHGFRRRQGVFSIELEHIQTMVFSMLSSLMLLLLLECLHSHCTHTYIH